MPNSKTPKYAVMPKLANQRRTMTNLLVCRQQSISGGEIARSPNSVKVRSYPPCLGGGACDDMLVSDSSLILLGARRVPMADRILIQCPGCSAKLAISDASKLGKKIRCSKCSEVFVAKAASASGAKAA